MPTEGALGTRPVRRVGRGSAALPRWSASAWGAIGVTAAFVAITCWWLAQDSAVQVGDAAQHLYVALQFRDLLADGDLRGVADLPNYYPPGTFLLGALATFVGGVRVASPIIAQNLVYVPLLALGCYQVGRLLAGPVAGLLAVVFALGAPLVIEQFHVFMLDGPQAALVAVTAWLVLASERFARVRVAALAGLVLGIAIASKQLAPLYLAGLLAAVLARGGGWRNWRGLLAFSGLAFLLGAPWYLNRIGKLGGLLGAAGGGGDVPPAASPPFFSLDNLEWYGWATVNGLLFVPLSLIALAGVATAIRRVARARPLGDYTLEMLCGLGGAWLVLTVMPHKDMRYTVALIVFLAALAAMSIVRLAPRPRVLAVAVLLAAAVAAHLGATFGVGGGEPTRLLPGNRLAAYGEGVPPRKRPIVYSTENFLVSGPRDDHGVLRLFEALRGAGVTAVVWSDQVGEADPVFESIGLQLFARIASLRTRLSLKDASRLRDEEAIAIRALSLDGTEPCLLLADDTGVWVRLGDPTAPDARNFCPLRSPAVYG